MSVHRNTAANHGFALILVLWAGVLLSVITASFALGMRAETHLAGNLVEQARAEAIADAGIRRGIVALLADAPGPRQESDGRLYELPFGDGSMRIRLTSEDGKIDLNGAPDVLIEGLLASLARGGEIANADQAARVAAAILDWRDPDQWIRFNGAEDQTYVAHGAALGARDGAFLSVVELNLVLGVDPDIYARLAPWVTVYSWGSRVDPMTAPKPVLLAVPGLDDDLVDRFVAARNAWHAGQSVGSESGTPLSLELLSPGARYFSWAESKVYTVDAVGVLPGGTRASRRAVVQLTGRPRKPYKIIAWFDAIPDSETDTMTRVR